MDSNITAKTPTKPLPDWDELVGYSLENISPVDCRRIETLKARKAPRIMGFGRKIVNGLFKDPAINKFASITWSDLVELLASQMSENKKLRESNYFGYKSQRLRPYVKSSKVNINRRFSQLPCTHLTVERRAEKAELYCHKDDPILLLGDDDMLSLGLCERGFTNVHVVDIDRNVLKTITNLARERRYIVHCHHQDLAKPLGGQLRRDFKMVFFDPFYSLEGVNLFLSAARDLTADNIDPVYFLSIHLMSLMRPGIQSLQDQLAAAGIEVQEILPSFNSYPVPKSIKLLVKIVNKAVIKDPVVCQEGSAFRLFTSDALILKRKV